MPSDFPRKPPHAVSDGLRGQLRRAALFMIAFMIVWVFFPEAHGISGFFAIMAGACAVSGVCELISAKLA